MRKKIDTVQLLDEVCNMLSQGHRAVAMPVTGGSMCPFLHSGDTAYLDPIVSTPKRGDIVLFRRPNGQYVLHRIAHANKDGSFDCAGDAQAALEHVAGIECICAKVSHISHHGKIIKPQNLRWRFYSGAWLWLRPLRRIILNSRNKK